MSFFVLIRVAFMFVLAAAFKKGELSVNKSTFNPFKLLVFILFVSYIIVTVILLNKMLTAFGRVERNCPGIMKTVSQYKPGTTNVFTCIIPED